MPAIKATHQQTKEHNRDLVLKTIIEQDTISRAGIARITGLTRATVSDLIADLIAEGLVNEVGIGESQGGKSPILLSLVEDSRYFIGLDLARNKFCGAIVNLGGKIHEQIDQPITDRNGDEALTAVYKMLDRLVQSSYRPLIGIGVGTPGLVNTRDGIVINAVNLDWKNLPMAHLLQSRYHLPVYIYNDCQAAAMGEYMHGDGRQSENNMVVINSRHGIGAGIIINGQLFQGDGGGAGEIGHVTVVQEGGLPCRCGNLGCLETVASAQAVVRRARMLAPNFDNTTLADDPQSITLDTLERAFVAGDPLARQVVLEAGRYMGMAISNLVGTLNIHKIVLAGDVTRFGQPWLEAIQETMSRTTLSELAQDTQVKIGQVGGNGIVLGAVALLLRDYSLLFGRQLLHD